MPTAIFLLHPTKERSPHEGVDGPCDRRLDATVLLDPARGVLKIFSGFHVSDFGAPTSPNPLDFPARISMKRPKRLPTVEARAHGRDVDSSGVESLPENPLLKITQAVVHMGLKVERVDVVHRHSSSGAIPFSSRTVEGSFRESG